MYDHISLEVFNFLGERGEGSRGIPIYSKNISTMKIGISIRYSHLTGHANGKTFDGQQPVIVPRGWIP